MNVLAGFAIVMNTLVLLVGFNTIFLQTNWNDPTYVGLVFTVMGTPVVNSAALISAWRRRSAECRG